MPLPKTLGGLLFLQQEILDAQKKTRLEIMRPEDSLLDETILYVDNKQEKRKPETTQIFKTGAEYLHSIEKAPAGGFYRKQTSMQLLSEILFTPVKKTGVSYFDFISKHTRRAITPLNVLGVVKFSFSMSGDANFISIYYIANTRPQFSIFYNVCLNELFIGVGLSQEQISLFITRFPKEFLINVMSAQIKYDENQIQGLLSQILLYLCIIVIFWILPACCLFFRAGPVF